MPYRDKISCSIERDSLDLYNFKANTRDKKLIIQQVSRMETWNTCFSELKKKCFIKVLMFLTYNSEGLMYVKRVFKLGI